MIEEPLKPSQVRHWISHHLNEYETHAAEIPPINPGWKGLLRGRLSDALPVDEDRYFVLGWVFAPWGAQVQPMSTKELSEAQWFALRRWMGTSDSEGRWNVKASFEQEAQWVAWERSRPQAQQPELSVNGEGEMGKDPNERLKLGGDGKNSAVPWETHESEPDPVGPDVPADAPAESMAEAAVQLGGYVVEVGPGEIAIVTTAVPRRKARGTFTFD